MLYTNEALNHFAKDPAVVFFGGQYLMYYSVKHDDGRFGVGIAKSSDLENWTPCGEVALTQDCERNGIAAPGAIVLDGRVHLFYQTYGNWEKDALCHAFSDDGPSPRTPRTPSTPPRPPGAAAVPSTRTCASLTAVCTCTSPPATIR